MIPSSYRSFFWGASSQDGDCNVELGLQCAGAIAKCFDQCKAFVQNPSACFDCLGSNVGTCCPCLQAAFPGLQC